MVAAPAWLKWLAWIFSTLVVFAMTTELSDLLAIPLHPYNVYAENVAALFLGKPLSEHWGVISGAFPLILTLIIVGLTAAWRVYIANKRAEKTKDVSAEEKNIAMRDIAAIYKNSDELLQKERDNSLNAIQQNDEFWKKRVEEERKNFDELLRRDREKFNIERDKLLSECQWLSDELYHARDETIQSGEKFYFMSDKVQKSGFYRLDARIVDDRTPGEKHFGEIAAMLKKYKG